MFRTMMMAVLLVSVQGATAAASAVCTTAEPSLVSVEVTGVTSNGTLNRYLLNGTVTNVGNVAQTANVLQFVDIYAGRVKLDSVAVPPLKAGESYMFDYASMRSLNAGKGTTILAFQLSPSKSMSQDCHDGSARQTVTF